jgi:putative transposase
VAKWARQLQVSTSGYYAWVSGKPERERRTYEEKQFVKKIFKEGDGGYGPDRICGIIRERGGHMGRGKASRYMADMGLASIHCRKRSRSLTNSKKSRGEGYLNILRYKEFPIVPRMALSSDITYLKSAEGFSYLCTVKDIVTGEILGHHLSDRMTKELVVNAFLSVQGRHRLEPGCIFHSDRGSQYTSNAFKELLAISGIRQSFSRVGMPGDNAWSESFFANMKKEKFHWQHYEGRAQVKAAVFEYIEVLYNGRRAQKRLGYISPREYFERLQNKELSQVA